jgi:hypothetical protein
MFSNAKVLKTAGASKKKDVREVAISGLETLAAIDAVIKSLTAMKETVEMDVKEQMLSEFITDGVVIKRRPTNFKGVDGKATGSCQLKSRSSASGLNEAEEDLLKAAGISVETSEQVASTFVINPAYKDDQKLLATIEKKLKTIKDLPEDFILLQEGKSKTIVTEKSIDEVFALADTDAVRRLLPVVSTLAVRPTLGEDDIDFAFNKVSELIG